MKLTDILKPQQVIPELKASGKTAVMEELCVPLLDAHPGLEKESLMDVLTERERLGSTGIGEGIAIPHGKLAGIDDLLLALGRSPQGVDFDSLDGKPAHLIFLVLAPENSAGIHLKALARISRMLKSQALRQELMAAGDAQEMFDSIAAQDADL